MTKEKRYRLNVFIPYETADVIRAYANKFGITMGGAIAVIINEYQKQQTVSDSLKVLNQNIDLLKQNELGE